jgi:hypothetical protein
MPVLRASRRLQESARECVYGLELDMEGLADAGQEFCPVASRDQAKLPGVRVAWRRTLRALRLSMCMHDVLPGLTYDCRANDRDVQGDKAMVIAGNLGLTQYSICPQQGVTISRNRTFSFCHCFCARFSFSHSLRNFSHRSNAFNSISGLK